MIDLQGKNILVTGGAGTGVGGGVSEALQEQGANLIIIDIDSTKLQRAQKQYLNALCIHADVSKVVEVERMFQIAYNEVGTLHGLVNNAGVGLSKEAHEVTEAEYDRLMDVNLKAYWLCAKTFANYLIKHKSSGNIVNISSIHAHSTTARYAIYSSSKNAIIGLTMGMALDFGKYGIRVNSVAPGYVHAEQNFDLISTWTDDPKGWAEEYKRDHQVIDRFIEPIDVGRVVAFLLSDYSRAITGQQIYVDQGTTRLLFSRSFVP